jgi:branched-chain amino acid transport system permease protein
MVVVGGMSSFLGPLLGAAVFKVLVAVSTMYTNLWGLVIGGVLVLIILLVRKGLADFLIEIFPKKRHIGMTKSAIGKGSD